MSRYIDADKTLAYISRLLGGLPLALLIECEKNGIDIVRCKECKYYKQSEAFCENGNGLWQAGDDCFCSYGQKEPEVDCSWK